MFEPRLDIWPPAQRVLWLKLDATYEHFTLNGGTALDTRIAAGADRVIRLEEPERALADPVQLSGMSARSTI
jgi:hypothetical protein